jgi:hypothetical protein
MDKRSDEVSPGIKNIVVHVAEFSCRNNEYIEGPRLLAQTITYYPAEHRTEDTTYYANGSVHSKRVTTGNTGQRKTIIYRYRSDGGLRDKWLVTYNDDGSRGSTYTYDSEDQLQELQYKEEESPTSFDLEEIHNTEEWFQREFDIHGNWIRETRFEKAINGDKRVIAPTTVTYRTISYF